MTIYRERYDMLQALGMAHAKMPEKTPDMSSGIYNDNLYAAMLAELETNAFKIVKLPEEHFAGDYAVVHVEGDEIQIDVCWIDNVDDARKVAAALLRAADQLEKQLAEERGPDGGEVDWGARADDARDAQVGRENGVTP